VKTTNGQTQAYNRGPTFDKFTSSFTIQGLKSDIFNLSKRFKKSFSQIVVTAEAGELIFGAGIDYSNTITCNLLNSSSIAYPQQNLALAEIPLSVEALESNSLQLAFDGAISSALPDLNYQTPVARAINKRDTPFSSASLQAAQIEKFYNTQRSTPFVWPSLDCLDLFEGQETDNVMITSFRSTPIDLDNWRVNMRIVTNV
jgi:hypothetical protein